MPFKKGHSIGRPKGKSNRSTTIIREAFLAVFEERGGKKGLLSWSNDNPDEFYKLVGKMVPKEMEVSGVDGGPIETVLRVKLVAPNSNDKAD